jgi:hypothetical protein
MKDTGRGKKVIGQLPDPVPGHSILLAATLERAPPKVGDEVSERVQRAAVCRHRMIRKEAAYDLPQPFPLFRDGLMHPPSHLLFDVLELRSHSVTAGFSLQRETPAS